jgi:molybdopterin adenylyltransferase
MRIAILTISTAGARGQRADSSGDAIAAWAHEHKYNVAARTLVTDDVNSIVRQLLAWSDEESVDLVLTTGGTGLSPTDVTPEATRAVIERDAPGIAEWLRVNSVNNFPKAALSRGVSGVRHRTLIVNLPGSPGGVKDALAALDPIVDHAVAVLRGEVKDHATMGSERSSPQKGSSPKSARGSRR